MVVAIRKRSFWLGVALALALAATARAQTHIVAVGDSLTHGGDWLVQVPSLAPSWTWEEHGVPGEQSWEAAEAIHCSPSPENCQVTQSTGRFRDILANRTRAPEDVIVLLWGTNDVGHVCWSEANPTGPDDCRSFTRDALAQMVDDGLAGGYPVVVGIPPPRVMAPDSPHTAEEIDTYRQHLELLRAMVEQIVAARPHRRVVLAGADEHFEALPGWTAPWLGWVAHDYYRSDSVSDGVHPGTALNPAGYSGRFQLAVVLVEGIDRVKLFAVPSLGPGGALVLVGAILGATAAHACRVGRARSS